MESDEVKEAIEHTVSNIILRVSANSLPKKGEEKSVSAVCEAIENVNANPDDLSKCLASVKTLCSLASQPENRTVMASQSLMQLVCARIRTFGNDEAFARHASLLIAMMLFQDDVNRAELGKNNGVYELTTVLRSHPTSVQVQKNAARALRYATWGSDKNCRDMATADSLQVLLEQLSLHSGSFDVSSEILACLGNMVYSSAAVREGILSNSSHLEVLLVQLAIIAGERDKADIVGTILVHLANHEASQKRTRLKAIMSKFTTQRGLDAIGSILKQAFHSQDEQMLLKYSNLIRLLSFSAEFQSSVTCSAWFLTLLKVLDRNVQNTTVLVAVLEAVAAIISGYDESKRAFNKVDELDGPSIILGVLKANVSNEAVVLECCRVLDIASEYQVSSSADPVHNKEMIGKAIVEAMADYGQNPSIQETACLILIKLAYGSTSYVEYLKRLGVPTLVEMARHAHPGHASLVPVSSQLLSLFSQGNSSRGRGPASARKSASMRLRSRSRTIGQGSRARSRTDQSRSPRRMLMDGRKAFEAARKKMDEENMKGSNGVPGNSSDPAAVKSLVRGRASDRKTMTLEPVLE